MNRAEMIEALKKNKEVFGLMPVEMQELAREIGARNFYFYSSPYGFVMAESDNFYQNNVYRLSTSYEDNPPKRLGWVETDVFESDGCYYAVDPKGDAIRIECAFGVVGFGGIYQTSECQCDCELGGIGEGWFPIRRVCNEHGPWKPTKVRFWQEVE